MPRLNRKIIVSFFSLSLILASAVIAQGEERRILTLDEFIKEVAEKDTAFQEILIDELKLKYERELTVPARDFVLSVESQYDFLLRPSIDESENTIGLSKLFPYYGSSVEAEYSSSFNPATDRVTSGFEVKFSQSIAENAFGRNTRLLDKIAGVEVEVASHQIIEAYEDYLAALIQMYYDWYSSYEDLKTGQVSYEKNLELLNNIKDRAKNKIALPIDVNKSSLQVENKRDSLVTLEDNYKEQANLVKTAIRYNGREELIPEEFPTYADINIDFGKDFERFWRESRTSLILKLLEDQSSLEVSRYADELLPSIDVFTGYSMSGDDHDIEDEEQLFFMGVTLDWPFPGEVEVANYQVSKIDKDKSKWTTKNTYFSLYTDLKNLNIQIEREKKLISIADEKIRLSQEIVKDELENYSLGRVTLNDLIDEINKLETNKFNKVSHEVQLKKLTIEWLRLTDALIKKKQDIRTVVKMP
ncbi:MAG: TolC family protein [Candidatus Omnitrophota bacterium]